MKILEDAGFYKLAELERRACKACLTGWNTGTLASPKDGGEVCSHGRGEWAVVNIGKRGGVYFQSPRYRSEKAARLVFEAFVQAAQMPVQGVA